MGEAVGFRVGEGVEVGEVVDFGAETRVGAGVGVGLIVKLAVIVPGPFTLAVVDIALELSKVMELLLVVHRENVYPEVGETLIESGPPSTHRLLPAGVVDPLPEGVTASVNWYCIVQLAGSVTALLIVTE